MAPGKEVRRILTLGQGELKILVRPWAKVRLDGKDLGVTPGPHLLRWKGRHVVVLENPEKGFRKRYTVTVDPGETEVLRAIID